MQDQRTKKMVTLAMLAALAYLVMVFIRIPLISFLKYEPKDVIIAIGGLIYGPVEAFIISFVVSIIEMVTVSDTGWIGAVMNLLSTVSFACIAALVYKKNRSLKGAIIGLVAGVAAMVVVMLLWNYLLTPIYMGYPREAVVAMLPTVFLPFNLLKGGLNAAITVLIYKPVVQTLRKARLVPMTEAKAAAAEDAAAGAAEAAQSAHPKFHVSVGAMIGAVIVLITCILIVLAQRGII